jgi:hypothetical protein
VQVARARLAQWTPRVEARFLAALAATCNVRAACAEAGLSTASAYNNRKRSPSFAARWDAAVEEGYLRLEAGLLEYGADEFAERDGAGTEAAAGAPREPMTVAQTLHLLALYQARVHGVGKPAGKRWTPPACVDDPLIRDSILRKLAALA